MSFLDYLLHIGVTQSLINGKDAIDIISVNDAEKYLCYATFILFIIGGILIMICGTSIPIILAKILSLIIGAVSIFTPVICIMHIGYTFWD